MGVLKDALEAMLATTQDGSARSGVSGKTPLVPLADLYNLFRSRGIAVLGASTTAFAVYDEINGVVRVYASQWERVDIVPYEVVVYDALNEVQAAGGSFMVCGEDVVCVLGDVLARGTSYGEAALRALSQVSYEQMRQGLADPSLKLVR